VQLNSLLFICFILCSFINAPIISAQEQQEETIKSEEKKAAENKAESSKDSVTAKPATKKNLDIPAPLPLEQVYKGDINHYLSDDEIKPLLAGPDDFITLIKESTVANNKGVAILLADWQQTAITPKGLNYLRKEMPNQGWTTISIQPPSKPNNYPSTALKQVEQEEEDRTTLTAYQLKLSAMIKTVMEKAKDYPGIFVVIAQGSHAAILTDLYQQDKNIPPNAFIVLSSFMPSHQANEQYASTLAQTSFPVLDLYLTRDHPLVMSSAKLRLSQANKEMKAIYRQRQITNLTSSYYPQEELLISIKGWLTSIGW